MKDIDLALFTGVDIPIPECQIVIHQPTIKEISMVGEKQFFFFFQVLCIDKDDFKQGENNLSNTPNFQIFMTVMGAKEAEESKKAVIDSLSLIIPNTKINMINIHYFYTALDIHAILQLLLRA